MTSDIISVLKVAGAIRSSLVNFFPPHYCHCYRACSSLTAWKEYCANGGTNKLMRAWVGVHC